jgi:hypothetical protein
MMPEPLNLRFVRSEVRAKRYRLTRHATIARLERGITIAEIETALLKGEILEQYPGSEPYPSCLVLGWLPSESVNLSAVSLAARNSCGNILVTRRSAHDPSQANRREQV